MPERRADPLTDCCLREPGLSLRALASSSQSSWYRYGAEERVCLCDQGWLGGPGQLNVTPRVPTPRDRNNPLHSHVLIRSSTYIQRE